jgi:class 3 adenylate cyclase
MGKAKGGVLIDEATFCRLPACFATKLAKPAAITVKGMTGPVQIYAYMEPEVLEASDTDSTAESLVLRQVDPYEIMYLTYPY